MLIVERRADEPFPQLCGQALRRFRVAPVLHPRCRQNDSDVGVRRKDAYEQLRVFEQCVRVRFRAQIHAPIRVEKHRFGVKYSVEIEVEHTGGCGGGMHVEQSGRGTVMSRPWRGRQAEPIVAGLLEADNAASPPGPDGPASPAHRCGPLARGVVVLRALKPGRLPHQIVSWSHPTPHRRSLRN